LGNFVRADMLTSPLPLNTLQIVPKVIYGRPVRQFPVPDSPVQFVLQFFSDQFRPLVLGPVSRDHPFLYAGRIVVAHRYDLPASGIRSQMLLPPGRPRRWSPEIGVERPKHLRYTASARSTGISLRF